MSTTYASARPTVTTTEREPVYRLTRRGRIVVLTLALVAAFGLGVVLAGGAMGTSDDARVETLVVAPGDTLWEIASDAADGGDVREMMSYIADLNDLDGVTLASGQQLRVPVLG